MTDMATQSAFFKYFGLREAAFTMSPDPRFLYMSPQHSMALEKCQYVINDRRGLAVLAGDVGMGKSTIARRLYELLDAQDDTMVGFFTFTPAIRSENAFLEQIMDEFELPAKRSFAKSLVALQDYLIDSNVAGKNVVLVVDEAQYLSPRMLKLIHTLLNFEGNTRKFMQVVLCGQKELTANIDKLPQIKSRVSIFADLTPLTDEDAGDMIAFRWQTASGAKSSHPFSDKALEVIYMLAKGLPREIIKLCNESLQNAFYEYAELDADNKLINTRSKKDEVTPDMVIDAAKDLHLHADKKVAV